MRNKLLWVDIETTGLDSRKNDIIQIGYIIEINNDIKEEGSFNCQPFSYENIDNKALSISSTTIEDLKKYDSPQIVYGKFKQIIEKYVNKYDKKDKLSPAGYNVRFDVDFIKQFFLKNNDKYYGVLLDYHIIDVFSLAYILEFKGHLKLENYKLVTLAKYFNIEFKAHNALDDIKTTREIFYKLLNYLK